MSIQVTSQKAQPVVPPPTYSITGLSFEQANMLQEILGKFVSDNPLSDVYHALLEVTRTDGVRYEVMNEPGYGVAKERTRVLHLVEALY